MKRLTDKEWITTKHFQKLNADEVLHRLWELENILENQEVKVPKFKVSDMVYFIRRRGIGKTPQEARSLIVSSGCIRRIYRGKTKITYYLNNFRSGIDENCLYSTEAEAEAKLKELKGEKE